MNTITLLLALSAHAHEVGRVIASPSTIYAIASEDGYHVGSERKEGYFVDGKLRTAGLLGSPQLSRDGKILAGVRRITARDGSMFHQLLVNGQPVGKPVTGFDRFVLGRNGGVALVARLGEEAWAVYSADGVSPVFQEEPRSLHVTDAGQAVYLGAANGWLYLYVGGAATAWTTLANGGWLAEGPDTSPIVGTKGSIIVVGDKELGGFGPGSSLQRSADGRHFAFISRDRDGAETAYLDGKPVYALAGKAETVEIGPTMRPSDGMPFYAVGSPGAYTLIGDGGKPATGSGRFFQHTDPITFSPSGQHYAYFQGSAASVLYVDGKPQKEVTFSLPVSPVVFDSENEYHFVANTADGVAVICGSIERIDESRSTCMRKARSIHGSRR